MQAARPFPPAFGLVGFSFPISSSAMSALCRPGTCNATWNMNNVFLVPLTQGLFAKVDALAYASISKHKWLAEKRGKRVYAIRRDKLTRKRVFMHRELMSAVAGQIVDHANCDTLDNTSSNLRFATANQNAFNQRKRSKANPYKGVFRNGSNWSASCVLNGVNNYLGTYDTPEKAALAYDLFAYQHHGEFARLNGV